MKIKKSSSHWESLQKTGVAKGSKLLHFACLCCGEGRKNALFLCFCSCVWLQLQAERTHSLLWLFYADLRHERGVHRRCKMRRCRFTVLANTETQASQMFIMVSYFVQRSLLLSNSSVPFHFSLSSMVETRWPFLFLLLFSSFFLLRSLRHFYFEMHMLQLRYDCQYSCIPVLNYRLAFYLYRILTSSYNSREDVTTLFGTSKQAKTQTSCIYIYISFLLNSFSHLFFFPVHSSFILLIRLKCFVLLNCAFDFYFCVPLQESEVVEIAFPDRKSVV